MTESSVLSIYLVMNDFDFTCGKYRLNELICTCSLIGWLGSGCDSCRSLFWDTFLLNIPQNLREENEHWKMTCRINISMEIATLIHTAALEWFFSFSVVLIVFVYKINEKTHFKAAVCIWNEFYFPPINSTIEKSNPVKTKIIIGHFYLLLTQSNKFY